MLETDDSSSVPSSLPPSRSYDVLKDEGRMDGGRISGGLFAGVEPSEEEGVVRSRIKGGLLAGVMLGVELGVIRGLGVVGGVTAPLSICLWSFPSQETHPRLDPPSLV